MILCQEISVCPLKTHCLMSALYFLLVQQNSYKCQVIFNYALAETHVLKCFLGSYLFGTVLTSMPSQGIQHYKG